MVLAIHSPNLVNKLKFWIWLMVVFSTRFNINFTVVVEPLTTKFLNSSKSGK